MIVVEMWIGNELVSGQINGKDVSNLISTLFDVKRYVPPDREPDFKHDHLEFYVNEGIAFRKNREYRSMGRGKPWGYVEVYYAYEAFFNKKENKVGLREIKKGKNRKMTKYESDPNLVKKFTDTVVENVLLLDMDEPTDFGKVPKVR